MTDDNSKQRTNKILKKIDSVLKGWVIFLVILHVILSIITLLSDGDPLVPLVQMPANLLIFAGVPYGIFWIIRKKIKPKS